MIGEPVQLLEQLEPGHLPEVPHLDSASVQLSFTHSSSVHFSFIFTIPKDWLCSDIILFIVGPSHKGDNPFCITFVEYPCLLGSDFIPEKY